MFYTGLVVLTEQSGAVRSDLQVCMQTSLFGAAPLACRRLTHSFEPLDARSSVLFEPGWVEGSDQAFEELRDTMAWKSMERPMYDRIVRVPRLICTVDPASFGPSHPLAVITSSLEKALQMKFSSVGLNYYRDGNDSVAWHRDRLGRTGVPTTVALVSLGSPRALAMRPHAQQGPKTAETTRSPPVTSKRWRLGHGDLLVMAGACQHEWEHCVPKERAVGARISMAFRSDEPARGSTYRNVRGATIVG